MKDKILRTLTKKDGSCWIHAWDVCTCKNCGKTRHVYPPIEVAVDPGGFNPKKMLSYCICQRCKQTNPNREAHVTRDKRGYMINECYCAGCKQVIHAWEGCKCKFCRAIRDEGHIWDVCYCRVCKRKKENGQHRWVGCVCFVCKETRNEGHDWDGCVCRGCKQTAHEYVETGEEVYKDGEWVKELVCKKCGR